jgi:hypothetical protein
MMQNRGCFDRHDDEPETNEYASSPCYMHEVDPSYFGSLPSSRPMSDWKPNDPKLIVNAPLKVRGPRGAIVTWAKLRALVRKLSKTIGRHAATQVERAADRRNIRAVDRLRARAGSKR